MSDPSDGRRAIGWLRAILTAAIIVAVGIGACVYVPNAILTRVHGRERGTLVGTATTVFFVALFAIAFTLRWLQRRKVL